MLGQLGAGGMGVVYLAEHDREAIRAAVKVIHAGLAEDSTFRARFRREVETSRAVTGRYVARVLDADADGSPPWLATEYVNGPSLADFITAEGSLPGDQLVPFAAGLVEGLAHIQAAGVVHRDLKPSNVMLTRDGPIIIDFGVARAADATALTTTGLIVGSAGWMAPEQVRGGDVGPAADVFAWGACTAFAATGRPPFGTGRADALSYRILHEQPDLDGVPVELIQPIATAMSKDARGRPTVDALRSLLSDGQPGEVSTMATAWAAPTSVLTYKPPGLRPPRITGRVVAFVAAVVALVAGAVGIYLAAGDRESPVRATRASETTIAETSPTTSTTIPRASTTEAPTTTAPSTTTAAVLTSDLVGQTDPKPSHWRPSDYEADQDLEVRVFDDQTWELVVDFPVAMNGCGTRQLRVGWRSLAGPILPGITFFKDDFDETPVEPEQIGDPSAEGTMMLNGCEQPTFKLVEGGYGLVDVAVHVSVFYPSAGG